MPEKKSRNGKRIETENSAAFKAKVAFAAISGKKTLAELAQQFDANPKGSSVKHCQLFHIGEAKEPKVELKASCMPDRATDPGKRFWRSRSARWVAAIR